MAWPDEAIQRHSFRRGIALTPACAPLPKNSAVIALLAKLPGPPIVQLPAYPSSTTPPSPDGWAIEHVSSVLKMPFSIINTLPPPPSSAGVPSTLTVPAMLKCSKAAFTAAPAPRPQMAIKLCPHACPTPFKASYSQQKPCVRPPLPWVNSATKAVGRSSTAEIRKPRDSSSLVRR